jgi:hypothetical protein
METIKILFLEEATEKRWKGNARADTIATIAENEEARLSLAKYSEPPPRHQCSRKTCMRPPLL